MRKISGDVNYITMHWKFPEILGKTKICFFSWSLVAVEFEPTSLSLQTLYRYSNIRVIPTVSCLIFFQSTTTFLHLIVTSSLSGPPSSE